MEYKAAPIGFLVMAAGHSRRFGRCKLTAQQPPNILPAESSLLECVIAQISPINAPIAVVTSSDKTSVQEALVSTSCELLSMETASPGLGDSIAFGVRATTDWAGWIVCLGDMPWLSTSIYRRVYTLASSHAQVAPMHLGVRGHPVFFSRSYFDQLSSLSGDVGAAHVIDTQRLHTFTAQDDGCLRDVDTPKMLKAHS